MKNFLNVLWLLTTLGAPCAGFCADAIKFDVAVLPEFRRYSAFLDYPGYAALALENNGLSPSPGTKMIIKERGRAIELRNGVVRFERRKGDLYTYEAGLLLGVARLTFPVVVDVSQLASGKVVVTMTPPLAKLLPADFSDRLNRKVNLVAGADTQKKVLAYLDELSKDGSDSPGPSALIDAVLVDAYNRSGRTADATQEGQRLPADQRALLITFVIWLSLMSALFAIYARRQRHGKSA